MTKRERIPHTDRFLQTFQAAANHAGVPAEPVQPADERTKVRCGNHGKDFRVYHGSVAEVRACYATYAAPKRQEEKPECGARDRAGLVAVLAIVERDYDLMPKPKGWLIEHGDQHGAAPVEGCTFCGGRP